MLDQYREAREVEASQQWISAAEAVQFLKLALKGAYSAQMRICARAHAGLIRARADHFKMDKRAEDNFNIPKEFWWAEGHKALKQNWEAGDFDTWIDHTHHLRAFGVSFFRADIEKLIKTGDGVLWLTDRKGRRVGIPVVKVAYVEVGAPSSDRRVGFGAP